MTCLISFLGLIWLSAPFAADSLYSITEQSVFVQQEELLQELLDNNPEAYEEALAEWQQYADNPVNLNTAQAEDLQKLGILDPWQIKALLQYRDSYGKIVRLEELSENVAGFDARTLKLLAPFVCLESDNNQVLPPLHKIIGKGKHQLLARYNRQIKASKAFTEHKYAGTPDNLYLRYTFDFKDRILLGFAAKQGAGEAFGKQGFDFYSGYLSLKSFGILKNLSVGTYKADFGYGLNIHSPAGFFGSETGLISGGGRGIRPYASGAEYGFLQGAAVQLQLAPSWQASLFYSFNKHDASLLSDSVADAADFWDYIKSFPETGYHRTASEIANKDAVNRQVFGMAVEKDFTRARIGFLASGYLLGGTYTPEHRTETPLFYSQVKPARGGNFSAYYQYLSRHFHFYGEAAISHRAQTAVLQGIQYKPAETFALDMRYTWQSAGYYAAYASIGNKRPPRPAVSGTAKHLFSWQGRVLLPADFRFEFSGTESIEKKNAGMPIHSETFTGYLYYEPRRITAYLRFRFERTKTRNGNSIRLNAAYQASNGFFGESRIELRNFSKGILLLQDAGYNAPKGGLRLRLRIALFHTQGYDSRIYAYEHDILYAASSPALYGKGMRFFILLSKSWGSFTAELKYAHTLMDGVQSIGSGDNTVKGFLKPEIKVQLRFKI